MRSYIIRRLLLMIPSLLLLSIVIFLIIRLIPGDVIDAMVAQMRSRGANIDVSEARESLEHALGLDVPVMTQYVRWIGLAPGADGSFSGILQGNWGESLWTQATVMEEIARRWPVTLELGIIALIFSQLIALPIGIYSALRQDTWLDYIGRSFAIAAIAVPSFWLATLVIVFPAIWWNYMPPIMHVPFLEDPLRNIIRYTAPGFLLGLVLAGSTMRMTRSMVLDVLRQDYIRTAWAKGLRERVVILRHVLKNALIPVITLIGLQVPILVGGVVIIEQIFVLPGMGQLILASIAGRDYPMVSGAVLFCGVGLMFINLIVDLIYVYLDPRVRYK